MPQSDAPLKTLPPGLMDLAGSLGQDLQALIQDHLRLAALETRLAGESLVWILALGLLAACLVFTGWLALVSVGMIWLIERNVVSASGALLLVAAGHGVITLVLVVAIHRRSRYLMVPEKIR